MWKYGTRLGGVAHFGEALNKIKLGGPNEIFIDHKLSLPPRNWANQTIQIKYTLFLSFFRQINWSSIAEDNFLAEDCLYRHSDKCDSRPCPIEILRFFFISCNFEKVPSAVAAVTVKIKNRKHVVITSEKLDARLLDFIRNISMSSLMEMIFWISDFKHIFRAISCS